MLPQLDKQVDDRARKAVQNFNRMLPVLRAYARAFTGDSKLQVKMGSVTGSAPGVIYLRPPLSMSDTAAHRRSLCDKRGPDYLYLCSACRAREAVMVNLYHEISHIAFGTFEKFEDTNALAGSVMLKVEEQDASLQRTVQTRLENHLRTRPGLPPYMTEMLGIMHPFLPALHNAIEDCRIDYASDQIRPGIQAMRWAEEQGLIENGQEQEDGTLLPWSEMPPNVQVGAGLIFKSNGHDLEGYLHPAAVNDLSTPEMDEYIERAKAAKNVTEAMQVTMDIVKYFRGKGYFYLDTEFPEPKPEDDKKEEDDNDDKDSKDGMGAGGTGEAAPSQGGQGTSQDGSGSSAEEEHSDTDDGGAQADDDDQPVDAGSGGDDTQDDDQDATEGGVGASDEGDDADQTDDGDAPGEDALESGTGDDQDGDAGDRYQHVAEEGEEADGRDALEWAESVQMGQPDELIKAIEDALGHEAMHSNDTGTKEEESILSLVIAQTGVFDTSSREVHGVRIQRNGEGDGWTRLNRYETRDDSVGETMLGKVVTHARRAFFDNRQTAYLRNQKSGRVSAKVLGRRAWNDDDRLFTKKRVPAKKDYFVCIGLDVSYSTAMNGKAKPMRESALALADVCHRLGVQFAVYAHTSNEYEEGVTVQDQWGYDSNPRYVEMYEVKSPTAPWDKAAKRLLAGIEPVSGNLDGHTLEFYRKILDGRTETDKVIMYFTDGAMPAENKEEEAVILERETALCKRKGYTLLGVGMGTNSPSKYGMDTVVYSDSSDLIGVIKHLTKRLEK